MNMKRAMALLAGTSMMAVASISLGGALSPTHAEARQAAPPAPAPVWPVQVWARTPYAPTAFPSGKDNHLLYELYLTNFGQDPVALTRVEVIDPDAEKAAPLASIAGASLGAIVQAVGGRDRGGDDGKPYAIPAGGALVLFLDVAVPRDRPVPARLTHRLQLGGAVVVGPVIGTRLNPVKTLSRPVDGADWLAADGPGNSPDNHHRRGIFIRDGQLTNSRRLATDWKIVRNGKSFQGDEHVVTSYLAYGKPLRAVADGTVVLASDGLPDNPPGHGVNFHPAVPVTIENAGGNTVVLDIGDGQFAHYYHMRAGSLRVKTGDHVRRGQLIGAIGASGDAREPHVHFELTTAVPLLVGEGVPYVIDHYRVTASPDGVVGSRKQELPLDGMTIDFGP